MADTVSPEVRSQIMAKVKSKGMKPELRVRKLLHRLGYRYRLHRSDLPGRPDLVFPARRKVIFVNGCFWHRHDDCPSRLTSSFHVKEPGYMTRSQGCNQPPQIYKVRICNSSQCFMGLTSPCHRIE